MGVTKEQLDQALAKEARQAAREEGKRRVAKESDTKSKEMTELLEAALASPGVQLLITIYRRTKGMLRGKENYLGIIDYVTPAELRMYGLEPIVQDYSGGGSYRCIIRVPQLQLEDKEVHLEISGEELLPKPQREQAIAMGLNPQVQQQQQRLTGFIQNATVAQPQPQPTGLPAQQLQSNFMQPQTPPFFPGMPQPMLQPGYGMHPYGYQQNPYGHQQYPYGMPTPFGHPQEQHQKPDPKDKILETLLQKVINQPTQPAHPQEDDDKILKLIEEQNRRWEEAERRRQESEERRREREDAERRWLDQQAQHAKELREIELRYDKERDERRWQELVERQKDNKNPTVEMIGALAPLASGLIQAFGSKEDANLGMLKILAERPSNEDRIAKLSEIVGNNMATNVGLIGTILTNLLAEKGGEDNKWWIDPLMQLIDKGGDVAKVALGGALDGYEEDAEVGEEIEVSPISKPDVGVAQVPPAQRLGAPPGMIRAGAPPNAAAAAEAARQRIAAAHEQMQGHPQTVAQLQRPPEGQVVDIGRASEGRIPQPPPMIDGYPITGVSIEKFDGAMQNIFELITGDTDVHEIAFLIWKHAASGVDAAAQWLNNGIPASRYLLGALRHNDEITVSDERILEVGKALEDLHKFLSVDKKTPEDYIVKYKVQRSMPKSIRRDPIQILKAKTASLDGQTQPVFGEGKSKSDGNPTEFQPNQNVGNLDEATQETPTPDAVKVGPPSRANDAVDTSKQFDIDKATKVARLKRQGGDNASTGSAATPNPALNKRPPKAKPAKPAKEKTAEVPAEAGAKLQNSP